MTRNTPFRLSQLMNKLRQRGSISASSETGSAEAFLAKPTAPSPPARAAEESSALRSITDVSLADFQVPGGDADASAEVEGAGDPSAPAQTTSGVGGSWSGQAVEDIEAHKPKVTTWGVFERPADISKAYGGGRRVGVGGFQPSEEEVEKKKAETAAKLAACALDGGQPACMAAPLPPLSAAPECRP